MTTKQKIYQLGVYGWHGNSEWEFTHPENKLLAEFQQDCQNISRKYISELLSDEEFKSGYIGTTDIMDYVSEKLPEFGYLPINESFERICFGFEECGIINEPGDAEDVGKLIGDDLMNDVVTHNRVINERYE